MNGSILLEEESIIDRRPIVTCAGELEVFSAIEDNLVQALPQEACEWRRASGRPVKSVHIGANFAPFSPSSLPKGNQWDLIRQPLFHIYWTECTDVDVYKSSVRDDIENWLKELTSRDINDWLIVVVENYDGKRAKQLLPRTTVLDKIRTDFAPKLGDRCISVINPGRVEQRPAESWRGLVQRVRHLLLASYARAVVRLEDHVRRQRELRNEPGWDFMRYFRLQEELAQVLEMLGLNDEALVQYDELDALFSQFVVNGITSESNWLTEFQKPLERWYGLQLGHAILPKKPSLLELRTYLFSKQAQMLLLTNKVWEMASRCLPFLHTCSREISILELQAPPGAVSCWLFLATMQVLQTCDKYNHADEVKEYSLHTASLWEYASQKLRNLGELCNLLPGQTPTSEQLHIVVSLSAGMGDNPGPPNNPSPTDKLKEALSSQDAFNKTYLELAELAMGTYKHIGRLRMARLVGREVASFYMLLGETQKAAAFLGDALRTFQQDGWHELAAQTHVELADCYKKAGDIRKLVRSCTYVSAALEMDTLIRWTYFDEMHKLLGTLDKPLIVPFDDIVKICSVSVKNDPVVMQDSLINVELVIDSNFPREVVCTEVLVSLESGGDERKNEKVCQGRTLTKKDLKRQDPVLQRLKIKKSLNYQQDKQLEVASIAAKFTELRRKDSSPSKVGGDFRFNLEVSNLPLVITPGINVIRLNKKASYIGKYNLGNVAIHISNLHLISANLVPRLTVEVKEEGPSLKLFRTSAPLLLGREQVMNLIITIGSYVVDPKSIIRLATSAGLKLQISPDEPLVDRLEFPVGEKEPFTSTRSPLRVFADMMSKDHQVTINVPWTSKPIVVKLNFTSPLTTSWRLYTVHHKKYIQVNVSGQCERDIIVSDPQLKPGKLDVVGMNPNSSQVISHGALFSYLWELSVPKDADLSTIKSEFSVNYKLDENDDNKVYKYFFDISDYQTLYSLDASVEPAKGNEFCRVGIVCHLHLTITYVGRTKAIKSVMYEVLAEPSVWAVCGRTAGVVSFEENSESQAVALEVMPLTSGHLPLPLVRISKYIPAECGTADKSGKVDTHPRLEPFSPGQVYNKSKGKQLHVLAGATNET